MSEFKSLAVGDSVGIYVIASFHTRHRIGRVERVTATQIVVGGERFNRTTGHGTGDNKFRTGLCPAEQATRMIAERKKEALVRKAVSEIRAAASDIHPDQPTQQAINIVREKLIVLENAMKK